MTAELLQQPPEAEAGRDGDGDDDRNRNAAEGLLMHAAAAAQVDARERGMSVRVRLPWSRSTGTPLLPAVHLSKCLFPSPFSVYE